MAFRTWVITMCGLVSAVAAGLFVLAPVETDTETYTWPGDAGVRSEALPLFPYTPHGLDVTVPCDDVRELGDGLVLATTAPPGLPVETHSTGGLSVEAADGAVTVGVADEPLVTAEAAGRHCEWSVTADENGTTVWLDGDRVGHSAATPAVTGLFTELPARSGVRATVVPDTRYESSPQPAKLVIAAVSLTALVLMFVLLSRADADRARRVRLLPRGWWRPRAPDVLVSVVLAGWALVGSPTVDDGYIVAMLKAAGDGEFVGNYFRWFNAPEAPFSWFYELYRPFAEVSGMMWWLRLPSVLLGLSLWLVVDRSLLPRLATGPSRWVRLSTAGTLLLWYLPFGVGLRPEPWVMLGTAVVFVLVERAVATWSLGALAASMATASVTVAVTPTGVMALAPFLAALPGLRRLARRRGPVVVPVALASAASALLLMFADQSLSTVLHSTDVRTAIGPNFGVTDEARRYEDLLDPAEGGLNRRMPLVLLWLTMAALAVLLAARRVPRLASRPTRRALLVAALFFGALAFTPTKYPHHLGAVGAFAAVLLAALVHTVASGALRRSRERSLLTAAVAIAVAYALAAPVRWWFLADLTVPWSKDPPTVGGVEISTIVLGGGLALAVAGLVGAWRWLPSPSWLLPLAAAGTVVLELVSVVAPLGPRAQTYNVPEANLASLSGCGVEDWLTVEPDIEAGRLEPAPGVGTSHGFALNGGYPHEATPPPAYGTADLPVWGSSGSAGTLTTAWYSLPPDAGSVDSPPLVVPVAGLGDVSATVQFGDEDGTVTRTVRLRLPSEADTAWREARLEPGDADRVRIAAVDHRDDHGWIAVGAPRLPRVVPLTDHVPVSAPVALDWVDAFFLPCRRPASVARGLTRPVRYLIASGPDSRWLTGMSYSTDAGGPYAPLLGVAERVPVPTYLRGDKLFEPVSVFRFDYAVPPLAGVSAEAPAHR